MSPTRHASPAPAAPAAGTLPVEHASIHQLLSASEDMAVLNNLYPPGGDSGFHAHHRDLFAAINQPQPSSSQTPGKPLKPAAKVQAGTAAYSPVSGEPRVHRVINNGQGPFQIIVIELRRASPQGAAISAREAAPQYVQITDYPKMRAWRLILEPRPIRPRNYARGHRRPRRRTRRVADNDDARRPRAASGAAAWVSCR
jgi:hypothetical protein